MMNLLIIREAICNFCQKYDRIFKVIVKFLYTLMMFLSWKQLFGYQDSLYQWYLMLALSFICAFLPSGVVFVLSGILACLDTMYLSYEVAGLLLAFYIVVYCLYLRLVPKKSWIIVLAPTFLIRFPCLLPLVVAMLVGPAGMVPTICGILLYYISVHVHELEPLLVASADASNVSPLNYLMQNLMADEIMLLYIVVFAVVIMITYLIYRSSAKYAWIIAIVVGTLVMMIALLAGSVMIEDELELTTVIVGCLVSGAIAGVIQFFRCVVDYSRTEVVQFEDDEYYYYVKAVPKLTISKKNVNITKINARQDK